MNDAKERLIYLTESNIPIAKISEEILVVTGKKKVSKINTKEVVLHFAR